MSSSPRRLLELYQASALVHDDIIDKQTSVGILTPHRSLANHHARGRSDHRPTSGLTPILVGDLFFLAKTAAADGGGAELTNSTRVRAPLADMHAEAASPIPDYAAEQTLADPERSTFNVSDALEVASTSAHYSVVHPAILGAICGASTSRRRDTSLAKPEEILTLPQTKGADDDLGVLETAVTGNLRAMIRAS